MGAMVARAELCDVAQTQAGSALSQQATRALEVLEAARDRAQAACAAPDTDPHASEG